MLRRRAFATLATSLLLAATAVGCGSDGDDAGPSDPGTTEAPASSTSSTSPGSSTTVGDAAEGPAYAGDGPYEVGTRTLALDDGRRVVVWYPAADSAADQPTETFDIASLLSPELQSSIPADLRPQYEIDAHPGAEGSDDGPFPVVLFSHGYAGFPEQSADLTTHLAAWGFVVVAPDHVERSLSGLLGTASQGVEPRDDTDVLSAALDLALADGDTADSPLAGLLDPEQVAVTGHSAGAGAAYREASADPRMKAFIAYSVGTGSREGSPAPVVPDVPGMVMLGTADGVIEPSASEAAYAGMNSPKYLVEIADAGHLVFSDICLIGRDQGGLVALIAAAGLDLPEDLLRLASDGCEEGDLDPAQAFDAIDHLSVAFLRSVFGIDAEPVGLDAATAEGFTTAEITLEAEAG